MGRNATQAQPTERGTAMDFSKQDRRGDYHDRLRAYKQAFPDRGQFFYAKHALTYAMNG